MTPTPQRNRGFSFLEIVVAVALVAVALIPIIQSSRSGIRRTGFNIHRLTATMLTNQLMERYRTMPYSWLSEQFGGGPIDMAEALKQDAILGSPFLPESYSKLIEGFTVRASFDDLSGDDSIGLLAFNVEWKASPSATTSTLSLGKVIINYEKFGIKTPGPPGGFVQEGAVSFASLTQAPTGASTPSSQSQPPQSRVPQDIMGLVTMFGSGFC